MRRLWGLLALALVASGACTYTPPTDALAPPPLAESTLIFDAKGRLITRLEAEENRENIRLVELPQHLIDAVVAIEDDRFWEHKGVDVKAILRAAVTNTQEGGVAQGGSTITQQYVKNALIGDETTINRKVKEALLAVQLERTSTKERILELYLNTIYFGNGAYGVQAAAQEYFGKPASEVNLAEAALLAGLIQLPSVTDPYDAPDLALARRNVVLDRMSALGYIDESTATFAEAGDLQLQSRPEEDRYAAAHFVDRVKRFVLDDPRFGDTPAERRQLLFGGGLRIQTTVDLDLQLAAEAAVGQVRPPEGGPDAALVSMEAATGYVRALVGGRDYFSGGETAKLDLATGGAGRSAGSSFKPLVLAAALEHGHTLDEVYPAPSRMTIPLPHGEEWNVENYEGTAGGAATLFEATVRSYNTVYAQLILDVGPEEAMEVAARMGISTPLQPFPSAVLGTNLVHPIDMATAYGTLANRGVRVDPVFVTRITRVDGSVVYEHQHRQQRAISEQTADEVTSVLAQAVARGTGTRARLADRPAAGKTGTGQGWKDAWFVGFTPDVVTAVWMGFTKEELGMRPPATPIRVTGGSWPAQIWNLYMAPTMAGTEVHAFPNVVLRRGGERPLDLEDLLLPRVPDVDGLPVAQARQVLEDFGYRVQEREVNVTTVQPGVVVTQTPAGGTRAELDQVVILDVATGATLLEVPDALGLREAVARELLAEAGFEVEVFLEPGGPVGAVWAQTPAGGTSAVGGTTVQLWVTPPQASTTTTPVPVSTTTTEVPIADGSTTTTVVQT